MNQNLGKVLIVDDDFMVREMIKGRVQEAGYKIVGEAGDGTEALDMVKHLHPDVVLMDIEMPETNGIEATRHIHDNYPTPVVMLTAYDNPELVEQAGQAGAGAYLVKPPRVDEIERAITIAITRFNDMMNLRELNAELDAFAHMVAHNLKNPLSLIVSYAELLRSELILSDDQRTFFSALTRNAYKMDNVIDELLLLAEMRKTEIEMKPLNMGRIVTEAQQRLIHMIQNKQVKITMPEHWPQAIGHGPWVEEIWENYISNGIKYGGNPPYLKLGATERSDGMIRFWIRDNGPGLTPEEQQKLFVPFTRLNQVKATGSGLGLSIALQIAEKMGGKAGVESEGIPGQGSTFFFTLPARS